jgi:3-carboxy-cis,cis-muconate cycloisomerase
MGAVLSRPSMYPGFNTAEMSEVFSAAGLVASMCRTEAALAVASARTGLFDMALGQEIAEACREVITDPDTILAGTWEEGSPVISLLDTIRPRLSGQAAAHLHEGATTQDIVDTAMALLWRQGLALLRADLKTLGSIFAGFADAERATPTVGRTFLQLAGPTTFGARSAAWLASITGAVVTLDRTDNEIPAQFGGPVGNRSGFGDKAESVAREFAAELGLARSQPWHTERSPVAAVAFSLSRIVAASETIASDLIILSQAEVGELATRPGGSSSIPVKKNPIDAVHCVAAATAARSLLASLTFGSPHQLERAAGAWHHELFAVPLAFQTTAATVEALQRSVSSVQLDPDRMAANLDQALDETTLAACDQLIDAAIDEFKSIS